MMMFIHLKIWVRPVTNKLPQSSMCLLSPLAFYAKPHYKFPKFCTQIATPSTTLDRGVIAEFFINKCGLTDEDIARAFKRYNSLLDAKWSQNCEEALELLNGCGLTAPSQIRRVVLRSPRFFCRSSESNIRSKLTLLRTFMKEDDISKLVCRDSMIFTRTEGSINCRISLLHRLGVEGEALSKLLRREPRFLTHSDEKIVETFKQVEGLGLNKGSKMFSATLSVILGVTKENFERRSQYFRSLGIAEIFTRWPMIVGISEQRVKLQLDFLVKAVGIPLHNLVKNPDLFGYSLEKRVIPRYRVMEALKSMQELKTGRISPQIFKLTEKCFLEKYVDKNANSSILQDVYHRAKVEKLETLSECVSVSKI